MRKFCALSMLLCVTVLAASAASIAGNVKGPDGKPFTAAFVTAENTKNKMTVTVLTDGQGRYHINNLPAATYSVQVTHIGYKADPRNGVNLAVDGKGAFDFALQTAPVKWSELNTYQGTQLLPKTDKHDLSRVRRPVLYGLHDQLPFVSTPHGELHAQQAGLDHGREIHARQDHGRRRRNNDR